MTRFKRILGVSVACAVGCLLPQSAVASDAPSGEISPAGYYTRKNGDTVHVTIGNGLLFCKIVKGSKPNFEMCHGMKQGGAAWTGKKMKHPGMPRFMTFNGTVTFDAQTLSIKGCAMGKSLCDKETWTRIAG